MKPEYENVCIRCSKTFIADNPETIYCDKCWKEMVSDLIKTDTRDFEDEDEDEKL